MSLIYFIRAGGSGGGGTTDFTVRTQDVAMMNYFVQLLYILNLDLT